MPSTTYKGLEVQTTGTNTGTWGDVLNNQAISYIDLFLGGIFAQSLAGSNVTLSTANSRNVILRCTGALSNNIIITTEMIGFLFVENLTTNAFTVSVRNASVATAAVIPQGSRATVISDTTNGCRIASDSTGFVAGTAMVFQQTAAPASWTKSTSHNNKAVRVVSGTASSGGTVAFTTAFDSQAVAGTIGGTAITINQMPLHGHAMRGSDQGGEGNTTGGLFQNNEGNQTYAAYTGSPTTTPGQMIGGTGGGQTHTHSFTGTPIDLTVQYMDVIVAVRN